MEIRINVYTLATFAIFLTLSNNFNLETILKVLKARASNHYTAMLMHSYEPSDAPLEF